MRTPEQIARRVLDPLTGREYFSTPKNELLRRAAELAFAECEKTHKNLFPARVFDRNGAKDVVIRLSEESRKELDELRKKIDPNGLMESMNVRSDIWDSWACDIRDIARAQGRRELAESVTLMVNGKPKTLWEIMEGETAKAEPSLTVGKPSEVGRKEPEGRSEGTLPAADIPCRNCNTLKSVCDEFVPKQIERRKMEDIHKGAIVVAPLGCCPECDHRKEEATKEK